MPPPIEGASVAPAEPEPAAPRRSGSRQRWLAIALLAGLLAGSSALGQWRDAHGLLINTTQSLPNWAFFIDKHRKPARGDFVVFAPPKSPIVVAHFGANPSPFAKRALGMPGDRVEHRGTRVLVNGTEVAQLKPVTRRGEPLLPGPTGVIPEHCYYLGTRHPDGLDSRYAAIGFVCSGAIVGTGDSLL